MARVLDYVGRTIRTPGEYDFWLIGVTERHPSGFIHKVPEPASVVLLGLGLAALRLSRPRNKLV